MWPWLVLGALLGITALVWLFLMAREVVRKGLRLLQDISAAAERVERTAAGTSARPGAAMAAYDEGP